MFQVISKKTGKVIDVCKTKVAAESLVRFCVAVNNHHYNNRDSKRNYIIKEV